MLKTVSRTFFSLVFPLHCELCGQLLSPHIEKSVCPSCEESFPPIAPPHCPRCGRSAFSEGGHCGRCEDEGMQFDRAYACMLYEGNARELLRRFKFERKRFLAPYLADMMTQFVRRHFAPGCWDAAVPVPMDRKRLFERGFNQSQLLSAGVAEKFDRVHEPGALGCAEHERPQALLSRSARKTNVEGRFFVRRPEAVCGRRVLLVDDILTTGHTASACAGALKEAGARSVTVLALARGA